MPGILYAIITVLAWGTWLAPSQRVPLRSAQVRTFYVASINFLVALAISCFRGFGNITLTEFWLPLAGGLIWAASGVCAFAAAARIGIAKAFGIWAPLNIIVSLICGRLIFKEFTGLASSTLLLLAGAIVIVLIGVVLIIFSRNAGAPSGNNREATLGYAAAIATGVLWGVYFVPVKSSGVSLWVASFPLAAGMFAGGALLLGLARASVAVGSLTNYVKLSGTGLLWTIGNYGMLLLVDAWGAGKGFTIAQLSVVVNAGVGIYVLKDPPPRSRAAKTTLLGCVMATIGGILLGRIK
jgi:glucose uptake protein